MYEWLASIKDNYWLFKVATFLVISTGSLLAYPSNLLKTVMIVLLLGLLALSVFNFQNARGDHFLINANELLGYIFLLPAVLIASVLSIFALLFALNELTGLFSDPFTKIKFFRCLPALALLYLIMPPNEIGPPNPEKFETAIEDGKIGAVRKWIGKYPKLVNQKVDYHNFPLTHAVLHEQYEMVELLLDNGAHIDGPDGWDDRYLHQNPLLEAIERDNLEMARLLLNSGALLRKKHFIEAINGAHENALLGIFAAKPPLTDSLAAYLLKHAAEIHQTPALETILKRGYSIDVRDRKGNTALLILAMDHSNASNSIPPMKILCRYGADINAKNNKGLTPIHILSGRCIPNFHDPSLDAVHMEIVRNWLQSGADPAILDTDQGNVVLSGFKSGIIYDLPFESSNMKPFVSRLIRFTSIFGKPQTLLTQKDAQGLNALDVLFGRIFYSEASEKNRQFTDQIKGTKNFECALDVIVEQLFSAEDSLEALYYRGARQFALDDYKSALKLWERAASLGKKLNGAPLDWSQNDSTLSYVHSKAMHMRDLAMLEFYDHALGFYPDKDHILNIKGIFLLNMGRYKQTLACFTNIIEKNPEYGYAWYNRACTYAAIENKDKMLKDLEKAVALIPNQKALAKEDISFKEYWSDEDFLRTTSELN